MSKTFRQLLAVLLCAATAAGCASTGMTRTAPASVWPQGTVNRSVLVEYVQNLPPGTLVRVGRVQGHSVLGTLVKATDQSLFIQPKTRVAESIVEIPLDQVIGVAPERPGGSGIGRAIGAGAAAGAGATLAIFLVMFALYGD